MTASLLARLVNRVPHVLALIAVTVAAGGCERLDPPRVAPSEPLFDLDASASVVAQPLGDLENGTGNANAINSGGVAVGESRPNVDTSDCLWRPVSWEGGVLRDLGLPSGYCYGGALAVSTAGHVVVQATREGAHASFIWTASSGYTLVYAGPGSSIPFGVNAAGTVVGAFSTPEGEQAFRWTEQEGFRQLPDAGGSFAVATGINDAGRGVGGAILGAEGSSRAVTWDPDGNISVLPLPPGPWTGAWGAAINDAGDVVGSVSGDGSTAELTLWPAGKEPIVIGRPASLTFFEPTAVTNNGLVAGHGPTHDGASRAAVWSPRWGFLILEPLPGGSDASAYGINNRGEVVGYSTDPDGVQKSVKWLLPPKWAMSP